MPIRFNVFSVNRVGIFGDVASLRKQNVTIFSIQQSVITKVEIIPFFSWDSIYCLILLSRKEKEWANHPLIVRRLPFFSV